MEVTVPTGKYDAERLANTSNNFYTYKPLFSFTWLPTERTELSLKATSSSTWKTTTPTIARVKRGARKTPGNWDTRLSR